MDRTIEKSKLKKYRPNALGAISVLVLISTLGLSLGSSDTLKNESTRIGINMVEVGDFQEYFLSTA